MNPPRCQWYEFICGDLSGCLDRKFRCNGFPDCPDGSDETYCDEYEPSNVNGKGIFSRNRLQFEESSVCLSLLYFPSSSALVSITVFVVWIISHLQLFSSRFPLSLFVGFETWLPLMMFRKRTNLYICNSISNLREDIYMSYGRSSSLVPSLRWN